MKTVVAFCLLCILGTCSTLALLDRQAAKLDAAWKQRESILQAKVAEAELSRRVDSVEVVKWATKTRTIRDSVLVNLRDTLLIQEFVYRTDTLRMRCEDCTRSASLLRISYDSLVAHKDSIILATKPDWFARHWKGLAVGAGLGGVVLGAWARGQ